MQGLSPLRGEGIGAYSGGVAAGAAQPPATVLASLRLAEGG